MTAGPATERVGSLCRACRSHPGAISDQIGIGNGGSVYIQEYGRKTAAIS